LESCLASSRYSAGDKTIGEMYQEIGYIGWKSVNQLTKKRGIKKNPYRILKINDINRNQSQKI